jgi:Omp85 superfamily domain/WD40-like Beta Propeller Repeat
MVSSLSFPQLYYFGRNKVHYDKFDWKILRTEHFNIYYYDEMGEIVEIGAKYAEETYNEYKALFNTVVVSRIPLIFYNTQLEFQQTNTTPGFIPEGVGGFFEFLKGRVVIPFTGSLYDFKHVIRHELVHVFMTNKIFRVLRDHRIPTDYNPPLWFTEGLAEYVSTKQDDQALMVMRDAIINNYFVNLDKIYEIYGTFFMYKEGQSFLEFAAEKYGKEKIPQFLENIWMDTDFNKVIAYTIGKPIEEIEKEWEFYLRRKYYPLLVDKAPPGNVANVLTDWGFNFSPVYHKTGKDNYIYFVANRNGYASLYRMKLHKKRFDEDFQKPELLLRGEKKEEFEAFHLFLSSIDVSSTGNIAFVTKMGGRDAIHLYSIKDREVFQNYQWHNLVSLSSPKFSHDGKMIVFNGIDQKGFSDIFILHLDSDSLERITNDYYDDKQPAFGFDDNQVLFSSDRTAGKFEKKYNIFAYDRKTHLINYITYLDANNFSPIISSDKKTLLFTSDYDGVRNVWMMKTAGNHFTDSVKQVTPFITSAFDQRFINDSTIVFSGFENFAFNLYRTKINWNDTLNCVQMKLDSAVGKWEAARLIKLSEKEKLAYKKQYTLDYAQSDITTDPVYGTRGGAIFSLSDLLGDDNYYFLIYNTATVQSDFLKSFNVEIEKINLGQRTNYGYGVFHFSGRRYDITQSEEYFFERSFGGFFLLQFPLSAFQRIDADVSIANSDKEIITGVEERKALLVSNTISWVMDNSIWGPSGPIDGTRARILLGYTGDVKYSNVNYYTFIADIRHYIRLGFPSALAVRASLYYNDGKEARRYFAGGSWDLRGWPLWSIRGEKLWLSSVELRFPLINEINIKFPFFDLGFSSIRGATFFDAGGAWDTKYIETLGSIGFGFRINLFGILVLRYDIGKKIENNFSQLQPRLFYQFFFGWDF